MTGTVLAIGAHPDDIEFMMAGTLILLKDAGFRIHCLNVANGSCGSAVHSRAAIVRIRAKEAQAAARLVGAVFHPSLVNDIEIFYEKKTLARLGAIVREANPDIVLAPSPEDYMEDHTTTSRLAVTATFCRGMRNFPTSPPTRPVDRNCTLYHALPYGLHDQLRRRITASQYVDIAAVLQRKRAMLACHKSQKEWLDHSQGVDAYLKAMEELSRDMGRMSGRFRYAEGWRRHSHLGFSPTDRDPLSSVLGKERVSWQDGSSPGNSSFRPSS
ncbi:MAG: PIG-L family deacetylase [Planctomycetota bacterium]|nr:PIG-L family deacetylase [Planctomycetota bacterium]